MHLDKDGAIRMDCSRSAMAGLLALRDKFDLAFANDPDYDRHGIVTPAGLMNPNSGRFDESEPLTGGGDQLPVPASSAVGQRCCCR